jgi:ATP-dependent Clp protease ATP-binding subunit ClpA
VDEIITFRSLDEKDVEKIARIMLEELKLSLAEKNIQLLYTDAALLRIAQKSFSRKYGARNMRRYIQREIEDVLAGFIIADYKRQFTVAKIDANEEDFVIHCL